MGEEVGQSASGHDQWPRTSLPSLWGQTSLGQDWAGNAVPLAPAADPSFRGRGWGAVA